MPDNRKQYKNNSTQNLKQFFSLNSFYRFSHLSETQQIHKNKYKVKNGTHKDMLVCFAFSFGREDACFFKIQQWNKDKI